MSTAQIVFGVLVLVVAFFLLSIEEDAASVFLIAAVAIFAMEVIWILLA